jgi:hypothetical protein
MRWIISLPASLRILRRPDGLELHANALALSHGAFPAGPESISQNSLEYFPRGVFLPFRF